MANPLQGMTFKRTVIVGLGSTGLNVLHAFQDFWYERFNNTDTSLVKLINIETDESNKLESKPSGTMITQIFINNNGMRYDKLAEELCKRENPVEDVPYIPWDWRWTNDIDWSTLKALQNAGAGGVRAGGRMLLYSPDSKNIPNALEFEARVKYTTTEEFKPIISVDDETAKEIFESLGYSKDQWVDGAETKEDVDGIRKSVANPHFESKGIKVVVVGSLAGGTASGMLIDIGFILQKILNISENELDRIYGIFVIPPYAESVTASRPIEWDLVRSNSFGAIHDILRMKDLHKKEKEARLPYGYVYLVAPEYNTDSDADRFKELRGLTDMIALRIFANVLGYQDKFDSQITDKYCKDNDIYLFSMGTGAILYPKHTFVEMAACELSGKFCGALINKESITDTEGRRSKLNLHGIKKVVDANVNNFSREHIYEQLKETPSNYNESVGQVIEDWGRKFIEDIKGNPRLMYRDYVAPDGYFRGIVEANKEKMITGILGDIEQELIQDLKSNLNLTYLETKMEYYVKEFKRLRYLWEIQGCRKFDAQAEIKEVVNSFKDFKKVKAPTDSDKIIKDMLKHLFDRFLLHKAYGYLDDVLLKLEAWQKSIREVMGQLENAMSDFHKRYQNHESRLTNDYDLSPVIKVFHKSEKEDYRQLKATLIGERSCAGWEEIKTGVTPKDFWRQVKEEGKVDTEAVKNILTTLFSKNIRTYLDNEGFNIFDKAMDKDNHRLVSEIFKSRVKSGFLKYDRSEYGKSELNPPHSVVASSTKEGEIRDFVSLYRLGCTPVKNPLMHDMIIYTKDVLDIEFEKLKAYKRMKEKFLQKHPNQPDWTKLRMAYSGQVDFTIIERSRHREIKTLLDFIEYFWFTKIVQPGGNIQYNLGSRADIPIPEAELDASGAPVTPGTYVDADYQPHIFIKHEVSLHEEDIELTAPTADVLSRICSEDSLYQTLKSVIKSNLEYEKDDFIDRLYKHYKALGEAAKSKEKHFDFTEIFSKDYEPGKGIKIGDIRSKDCLIARVYNILYK
jgi:hypothetical protein